MFPSTQDYKIALMIGADSFRTLQDVEVVMNPNYPTEPWFSTGGLAIVFKIRVAGKPHALKCFYKDAPERQERLGHIAAHLKNNPSEYFINFEYLEDELWVETNGHGQGYAVLLMEWVEGETLDNYLERTCRTKQTAELQTLYYRFCSLAWWLHQAPFAHGDLKHDNIIVTPEGNIKLIDYDGMYVPALSGRQATEQGSPCYQHPQRNAQHFDARLDDFSLLILQITLLALWKKPELFAEHYNGDGILLKDTDYQNFDYVPIKQIIWQISEPKLPVLLGQLSMVLQPAEPNLDLLTLLQDQKWISWLITGTICNHINLATDQVKLKGLILADNNVKELFVDNLSLRHALQPFLLENYKENWEWIHSGLSNNGYLPWSLELIEKYKEKWLWGAYGLSGNTGLPWSLELIEIYKEKWEWGKRGLSGNIGLPWSLELIEKYKDKWHWGLDGLSMNSGLPWSLELIEKYKEKWLWGSSGLSRNTGLPWSLELIEKYKDKWHWGLDGLSMNSGLPWSLELIEKYEGKWCWGAWGLSRNTGLPWSLGLIEKYKERWEWGKWGLSGNTGLPWSLELIEKYEEKWEWIDSGLTMNSGLPWSLELIEKYKDKWRWGFGGLSMNSGLPWSLELIEKYKEKWSWYEMGLSGNTGLPWSIELIEKYKEKWEWEGLFTIQAVFSTVFKPYLTDDFIDEIMSEIVKLEQVS